MAWASSMLLTLNAPTAKPADRVVRVRIPGVADADGDQVANLQAEHALVGRVVAGDDDQVVALLLQAADHRRPLIHLRGRHLDDLLALADVDRVVGDED